MRFSQVQFEKNADLTVKKLIPKTHREVLDGMEVHFEEDGWGIIDHYSVDGEDWYLYPVHKNWCEDKKQLSLF